MKLGKLELDRKKLIIIAVAAVVLAVAVAVVLIFVLGSKGAEEPEMPAPVEYSVENTVVAAIPEQKGMQVEPLQSDDADTVGYAYTNIKDVASVVNQYVATLLEDGMCFVDESLVQLGDEPELDGETSGEVRLAQKLDDERSLSVHMAWEDDRCTVQLQVLQERIRMNDANMTFMEAVDYMYTLSPGLLGLERERMEDYRIYVLDGAIIVDNKTCMQLNVYELDETLNTNVFVGSFLVSADGRNLYRLEDGKVTRIS